MRRLAFVILALLAFLTLPLAATEAPSDRRCSKDGGICIRAESYVADVCRVIEEQAALNALDPNFLARLLWKESLFKYDAISHAGAQGIAQFMPGTARIVGLEDPFNPAQAIPKSARYLSQLTREFGNIGMAAVAYNGGEDRAARYIRDGGQLPSETLEYVHAITGHPAKTWRIGVPDALDMRLDATQAFYEACTTLAAARQIAHFKTPDYRGTAAVPVSPWGAIVASHASRAVTQRKYSRARAGNAALRARSVSYVRRSLPGMAGRLYTAQVGFGSRSGAQSFCAKVRAGGSSCIVLRN